MQKLTWTAIGLAFGLVGCGGADTPREAETAGSAAEVATPATPAAGAQRATAVLRNAEGATVGTATATSADGAVTLALNVEGLPPGAHGTHVHTTGQCDGPGFESAGGHWNPASTQHGLENPQGQHAGDMPNLTVGADGRGTSSYALKGASFESLFDADGGAMVVHASADDQKTDPSGDSGARIACGVFTRE